MKQISQQICLTSINKKIKGLKLSPTGRILIGKALTYFVAIIIFKTTGPW